jgi:hypothetical protein
MSWEDQGRQEHGWLGHGTAPEQPDDAANDRALFAAGGLGGRIGAAATGAVGALTPALRRRAEKRSGSSVTSDAVRGTRPYSAAPRLSHT